MARPARPARISIRCLASSAAALLTLLLFCLASLAAPPRPTGDHIYPRVILVVPLIGSGTPDDPQRPMFAHSDAEIAAAQQAGKPLPPLSFHMEVCDDGKTAIVEFSSPNPAALAAIRTGATASTNPSVHLYDTSATPYTTLEQQLRQVKAPFKLYGFFGAPPPPAATVQTGAQ